MTAGIVGIIPIVEMKKNLTRIYIITCIIVIELFLTARDVPEQ